jgi:uncharacterized protein (DUF779 family)
MRVGDELLSQGNDTAWQQRSAHFAQRSAVQFGLVGDDIEDAATLFHQLRGARMPGSSSMCYPAATNFELTRTALKPFGR